MYNGCKVREKTLHIQTNPTFCIKIRHSPAVPQPVLAASVLAPHFRLATSALCFRPKCTTWSVGGRKKLKISLKFVEISMEFVRISMEFLKISLIF
jgi:hypothetical protein